MLDHFLGGIWEKMVLHGVGEKIAWAHTHYLFILSGFSSPIYRLWVHFQTIPFFNLFINFFVYSFTTYVAWLQITLATHFIHVFLFFSTLTQLVIFLWPCAFKPSQRGHPGSWFCTQLPFRIFPYDFMTCPAKNGSHKREKPKKKLRIEPSIF